MKTEVIMPKQGIYEGDVTLVSWIAAEGSTVRPSDPLFLMENEKVVIEIEAEDGGILQHTETDGFVAPVGSVVGWLHSTQAEYDAARAGL
jgi:pyruvate/2-oxoglutarate dehydrogenase complex dihydrolipoamide acyltransferase (E2) component